MCLAQTSACSHTPSFSAAAAAAMCVFVFDSPKVHLMRSSDLVCKHMLPDCANPNGRDVVFVHFVFSRIWRDI